MFTILCYKNNIKLRNIIIFTTINENILYYQLFIVREIIVSGNWPSNIEHYCYIYEHLTTYLITKERIFRFLKS